MDSGLNFLISSNAIKIKFSLEGGGELRVGKAIALDAKGVGF